MNIETKKISVKKAFFYLVLWISDLVYTGSICPELNYVDEISYSYLAPGRVISMTASIWYLSS